jgi:hypothetical protein
MATQQIPGPDSDAQALAVELTAAALARLAPEELVVLDESAAEYFADPAAALRGDEDTPLGSGISVEMLTPYLLSAAGVVLPILGEILKGVVTDMAKEPLSAWVRRLIKRNPAEPPGSIALDGAQAARVRQAVVDQCGLAGLASGQAALIADATIGSLHVRP